MLTTQEEEDGIETELAYIGKRICIADAGADCAKSARKTRPLRAYLDGLRLTLEKERQEWREPAYTHHICLLVLLESIVRKIEP